MRGKQGQGFIHSHRPDSKNSYEKDNILIDTLMSRKTFRMCVFIRKYSFWAGTYAWPYLTDGVPRLSGIPVPQNFTKVNIFYHKLYFYANKYNLSILNDSLDNFRGEVRLSVRGFS